MLKAFKELHLSTKCIVDCTKMFIEMPTFYRSQSAMFSSCKHHNTAKGLIGISPSGSVTLACELYTGWCSDKINNQWLWNFKSFRTWIFCYGKNRGFNIEDDLLPSIKLNIPPFLQGNAHLKLKDELDVLHLYVKNYRILQSQFQFTMAL